ncbi:uncharacterized protein [Arachis hypogaea]|uniref:DUF4378 domain-containing protein n=1 Tax=Arachis hypogaea TaxID=3818 RepID=A0A445CPY1_ARAHY|nr:uncharacterized protein LOC112695125 [Arachis hypogaea]XP_025603121.1 uncharacterized protein LOC112695125 [Arachis hypogaea]XP_025603123.1 uncharacterized protein LOC112695125 [Arachis hypogaea]QHO45799.1 uncharacterized protein DS421_6g181960 [Arachis hypogaea]QHO45800.1 uncharacterized protein DS421_6g181960 [Arachis hypogaea]QHO45801.1 uncharacterized protein DS421_6g181960 [Arachis hypogaea]QHO45802.1 uncharacterized protein DS421_6g181960 [Arachis hypogaea]RYR52989.1 hypothetical pr
MNGVQNRRVHNVEKPFPGCLGRMVNLFDLTAGVSGNRLLTDKPHHDASSLLRSQSDVARITNPSFGDQLEDKLMVSDSMRGSSQKRINGTPIKMLIDQEMSKEIVSKHNPPNVVAKLMGLEALPRGEPNLAMERSYRGDYSQHMHGHSGTPFRHWQLEDRFMDKEMLHEGHPSTEQIAYRDIYEIWLQSQRMNNVRDTMPNGEKWTEDVSAKKMAFIRQKFIEAKRLSTDERLRQSKEFDEALEVLSSNNDLLIRLLDSQNLYELQSTPIAETKRITVLKPSKMVDREKPCAKGKNDKYVKKPTNIGQAAAWEKTSPVYSPASQKVDDFPVQPTRIVVLKPSSGKTHEIKAVLSPTTSSPRNLHPGSLYHGLEDCDALEQTTNASEIAQQIPESLRSHQRDETLHSSVFSNGYIGDESSFYKSDNEYAAGNLSDLELMSPSPRHSWDYINRCGSPFSSSSFSRASCSPESSVCREAKKRLSERWAMMASTKGTQEQRHLRRSSTLGEMLALSDMKKVIISEVEDINRDQGPSYSVSCSRNISEEICMDGSPKNLPRSKSVPVSSTVYETGPSTEVCDHDTRKAHVSKELTKSKSMKSSFKGKVTNFFLSRNKRSTKEKSFLSQSKEESQSTLTDTSVSPVNSRGVRDGESQSFNSGAFAECSLPAVYESSGKSHSDSDGQGVISLESTVAGTSTENQDQPSPISVLEPPFEDENAAHGSLDCMKGGQLGSRLLMKSNLIDKSPPIESIARTLSWDDSCAEVASPYPLKPSLVSLDTKVEEQDWFVLVDKLLLAAGLDNQVQSDSFYPRWHSLDSALDPSLRDNYANPDDKEPQPLPEARRRQRRSNQKLVFDCVNVALMEITGYGSEKYVRLWGGNSHCMFPVLEGATPPLVDLIVAQMKDLISGGMRSLWGDCGDSNSLVVESVVRKEVVGNEWVELMGLEMDILVKVVEGKLLEELVEDAVLDLTGRA